MKKLSLWALQWAFVGALLALLGACGAQQEAAAKLPQPVVNQTSTFTVSAKGLTVTFDASAFSGTQSGTQTASPATYQWNFGDGTPVQSTSSVTITHVYAASGTYVVNLVVLDAQGVAGKVLSQNVTVAPLPANQAPSAQFASAVNLLSVGVDASLSSDPDGTITTYAWNFGDPNSSTNTASGKTATHTYGASGTYTVTLVVTDNTGLTATSQQRVNVVGVPNVNPIANFTSSRDALLVNFTATASIDPDGTITTYSWNFGEPNSPTNTATGVTTTHGFKFAGSYTVTLTVTDNQGGTSNQQTVVTVITPVAIATGVLNDTGINASQCYQAGTDTFVLCSSQAAIGTVTLPASINLTSFAPQDGMTGRDADTNTNTAIDGALGFSFTKIGANGETLPTSATQWSCVKDNVTGLMWENKTDDVGLHNINNTYTNYDSTTTAQFANGGIPNQADIDAPTNSIGFKNAVNAQGLCGATDWRIPESNEIRSVWNYSTSSATGFERAWINWTIFSITNSNYPVYNGANGGIFNSGIDSTGSRASPFYLNLVCGALANPLPPSSRFVPINNGQEVIDQITNLVWQRCPVGMTFSGSTCLGTATSFSTHEGALNAAAAIGNGWQIPNVKELASIINRNTTVGPLIDLNAFPDTPNNGFWSSTPYINNVNDSNDFPGVWYVAFQQSGSTSRGLRSTTELRYLRLVRTGCGSNC